VDRGEIVALIGPNGSGKSTTFLTLCGLIRPDAGAISFAGRPLRSDRGRTIALIAETPDVYPLLTVWEHLAFAASLARIRDWSDRAGELLRGFGLDGERETLGSALSKGMRQKTLIAATILAETPVLLLDEPMIGLDPLGQRELRELLRDLRSRGHAIMFSTHQLEAAEALCDRVSILRDGSIIATGTLPEIHALGEGSLEDVFLQLTRR